MIRVSHNMETNRYEVIVDGEVVGEHEANRDAWRQYDKLAGEIMNRAQDVSDWIMGKDA